MTGIVDARRSGRRREPESRVQRTTGRLQLPLAGGEVDGVVGVATIGRAAAPDNDAAVAQMA